MIGEKPAAEPPPLGRPALDLSVGAADEDLVDSLAGLREPPLRPGQIGQCPRPLRLDVEVTGEEAELIRPSERVDEDGGP